MDSILYSNAPMFDRHGNYLGYRLIPSGLGINVKIALLEHQAEPARYALNLAMHDATCAKVELRHYEAWGWCATETGDPFAIQDAAGACLWQKQKLDEALDEVYFAIVDNTGAQTFLQNARGW